MTNETNLASATADALTNNKAYDIAGWIGDVARWVHAQGEQPPEAREPRPYAPRHLWDEYNAANNKRGEWEKTPAGIMANLLASLEDKIKHHAKGGYGEDWPPHLRKTFKQDMNECLENAANALGMWLENWRIKQGRGEIDSGEAECQKLIERGKFFFSFWMPEPVAAEVVKIRGGTVEEKGSGTAGMTLTPTASTSPRLKM